MVIIHTNIKTLGATEKKSKLYQHMYIKYLFLRIVMKKKWYAITRFLEIGLKNPSFLDRRNDQSWRTYSLQQIFSINSQVFFEYIYTVLSVFFSFIVIRFYFAKISTCTCPKSVLIYNFKADIVTKNHLHFCPRAFSVNQLSRKCARSKMYKTFGHSINLEIINKNTYGACTCRYFSKMKANNYKGKEYGQDSINILEKYL